MLEKNSSAMSEVNAGPIVLGILLTSERSQTNNNVCHWNFFSVFIFGDLQRGFVIENSYDIDRLRGISSWSGASGTFKEELYRRIFVVVIFTNGPS